MTYDIADTGDYAADNAKGHALAAFIIRDTRDTANPTILGHVIRAMIAAGEPDAMIATGAAGGVRVGLAHGLSCHLLGEPNAESASPRTTTLIRLPAVREMTGLSKTEIYRQIRQRRFPDRRQIGPRLSVWVKEEIDAWVSRAGIT